VKSSSRQRRTLPPPRERTEWQKRRDAALAASGYKRIDVMTVLEAAGVTISDSALRHALDNRYRDDNVRRAFCSLVGQPVEVMFPDDEPRYVSAESTSAASTSRR
jgi:hypothetical protein